MSSNLCSQHKKICIYALDFKIFLFPNKRLTCPNIQKVSTNRSAIKMPELVSFFRRIQSAKNKPLKPEEMMTFFKFCFKLFDLSHYKSLLNADTLRAHQHVRKQLSKLAHVTLYCGLWALQQRRQQYQRKHFKINIWEMVTVLLLLLHPHILYC